MKLLHAAPMRRPQDRVILDTCQSVLASSWWDYKCTYSSCTTASCLMLRQFMMLQLMKSSGSCDVSGRGQD